MQLAWEFEYLKIPTMHFNKVKLQINHYHKAQRLASKLCEFKCQANINNSQYMYYNFILV